jgi:ribonucleoside-diphosphate reductase alpha chain
MWLAANREIIAGLSFLPAFDADYAQKPYERRTREEIKRLLAEFPVVDWSKLWRYETMDLTTASSESACVNGICEIPSATRLVV